MIELEKKQKLKSIFKGIDDKRLMFGPDEREALFLHGMMLGIREYLEFKGIDVDGVTGLWWYEELNEKGERQIGIEGLKKKYSKNPSILGPILLGNKEGVSWVKEVLNN